MHYLALASDYDGTLSNAEGRVEKPVQDALRRLRDSGRKLILVTGRELDDLLHVYPDVTLWDLVIAENGAVLYDPTTRIEKVLCSKADPRLFKKLQEHGATPLSHGRAIIATREPYEVQAIESIRELGLELHVIFNKGAVMILPSGVNKETGLRAALAELGLSPHNVVGVGDGENDHALLQSCGCGVAVSTALPSLKEEADLVTQGGEGKGVVELIERILGDDLRSIEGKILRHQIRLGQDAEGRETHLMPENACVLICGPSGSGKTTATSAIVEKVAQKGYQFCIVDPEGDYGQYPGCVRMGDPRHSPSSGEVAQLLEHFENPVVNFLGIPLTDRPLEFSRLLASIQDLRVRVGRPHWLVIDEAHHLLPEEWRKAPLALPTSLQGTVLVTVHPEKVSPAALRKITHVLAVGPNPAETIRGFCDALGETMPPLPEPGNAKFELVAWFREEGRAPFLLRLEPGSIEHDRHQRKYAQGDLEEDAFCFRGPEGRLKLRAQNLAIFIQIGEGVDDETWTHHLKRHDYSEWIRRAIRDTRLAEEVGRIEDADLPPPESRRAIREAIEKAYTAAA